MLEPRPLNNTFRWELFQLSTTQPGYLEHLHFLKLDANHDYWQIPLQMTVNYLLHSIVRLGVIA